MGNKWKEQVLSKVGYISPMLNVGLPNYRNKKLLNKFRNLQSLSLEIHLLIELLLKGPSIKYDRNLGGREVGEL